MGHNRSPRVERPAVLVAPLALYASHVLHCDCGTPTCGGERLLLMDLLIRAYGGEATVSTVIDRLRCPECLQAARRVVIRRPTRDGRISPTDRWLTLKGWDAE